MLQIIHTIQTFRPPPGGIFLNGGNSQYSIGISIQNQTVCLCHLLQCYLFSVSISTFVCFYSTAERVLNCLPIIRFITFVKEKLISISQLNACELCTKVLLE